MAEECLSLFIGQICSVLFQHTKAGTVATSIFIYSSYNYVWALCKIRYSVILKPSQSFFPLKVKPSDQNSGLWTDRWLAGLITWFKTKKLQRLLTHLLNFQPSWWKIIKSIITTAQTVHNNTHSHYNRAQYKHRSAFWRRTWPQFIFNTLRVSASGGKTLPNDGSISPHLQAQLTLQWKERVSDRHDTHHLSVLEKRKSYQTDAARRVFCSSIRLFPKTPSIPKANKS